MKIIICGERGSNFRSQILANFLFFFDINVARGDILTKKSTLTSTQDVRNEKVVYSRDFTYPAIGQAPGSHLTVMEVINACCIYLYNQSIHYMGYMTSSTRHFRQNRA